MRDETEELLLEELIWEEKVRPGLLLEQTMTPQPWMGLQLPQEHALEVAH